MISGVTKSAPLLLIEDNAGDAFLIRELLNEALVEDDALRHAVSLADALGELRSGRAHFAILLDLRLPDSQGFETFARVFEHANGSPVVVLTGLEDDEIALRCVRSGAQDFVSKQRLTTDTLRRSLAYAAARAGEQRARKEAAEVNRLLAAIVTTSSDAIISSTIDGMVTSWNPGAERLFGYTEAEAIGQPSARLVRPATEEEQRKQTERRAELTMGIGDGRPVEIIRLARDGTALTLSATICQLRDELGRLYGLAAICRDITTERRRDAELTLRNAQLVHRDEQLRALATRLTMLREEERTRISRTVHDELGQLLTGLKLDLRWIQRRLDGTAPVASDRPDALTKLEEAVELIDRASNTVQQIAVDLRPGALDALGLAAAIRDEARRFSERTGVATSVTLRGVSIPDHEVSTSLFRILQELLTNIARHAFARSVEIALDATADDIILTVNDDGIGLPASSETLRDSLGLLGMQERAASHGGEFIITTRAPRGTSALTRIPVRVPKREAGHA